MKIMLIVYLIIGFNLFGSDNIFDKDFVRIVALNKIFRTQNHSFEKIKSIVDIMNNELKIQYPDHNNEWNVEQLNFDLLCNSEQPKDILGNQTAMCCGCFHATWLLAMLANENLRLRMLVLDVVKQVKHKIPNSNSLTMSILACRYLEPFNNILFILQDKFSISTVQGVWLFPVDKSKNLYAYLGFDNCMTITHIDVLKKKMAEMWQEIIQTKCNDNEPVLTTLDWNALEQDLKPYDGLNCLTKSENWIVTETKPKLENSGLLNFFDKKRD